MYPERPCSRNNAVELKVASRLVDIRFVDLRRERGPETRIPENGGQQPEFRAIGDRTL